MFSQVSLAFATANASDIPQTTEATIDAFSNKGARVQSLKLCQNPSVC